MEVLSHEEELTCVDIDLITDAAKRYLGRQEGRLCLADLNTLKSGYVSLINGKRDKPDVDTYLRICKFVSSCHKMSGEDADEMILFLKRVTHINGKELPIPKSFRKVQCHLTSRLKRYRVPIIADQFDLPAEIFGQNCHDSGNRNFCLYLFNALSLKSMLFLSNLIILSFTIA
jgi:hypothetical protein